MGFSTEWEDAYKSGTNISIWPWSDLISLFCHYFPKSECDYSKMNVLELGCGAGANIPFFEAVGANYYSIEGSRTEVTVLNDRYTSPKIKIVEGDFSREIPFDVKFDLIFDRAAVAHNDTSDIKKIVKMSHDLLKKDGFFIGIDWFATKEKEYGSRQDMLEQIDDRTFKFGGNGTYANLGNVHFTDKEELLELFSDFVPQELTLKSVETVMPYEDTAFHWNFVMKKKCKDE